MEEPTNLLADLRGQEDPKWRKRLKITALYLRPLWVYLYICIHNVVFFRLSTVGAWPHAKQSQVRKILRYFHLYSAVNGKCQTYRYKYIAAYYLPMHLWVNLPVETRISDRNLHLTLNSRAVGIVWNLPYRPEWHYYLSARENSAIKSKTNRE